MRPRIPVILLAAMTIGGVLACRSTTTPAPARAGRPNIVFVLTDDQRWDAISLHGDGPLKTPDVMPLDEGIGQQLPDAAIR